MAVLDFRQLAILDNLEAPVVLSPSAIQPVSWIVATRGGAG